MWCPLMGPLRPKENLVGNVHCILVLCAPVYGMSTNHTNNNVSTMTMCTLTTDMCVVMVSPKLVAHGGHN